MESLYTKYRPQTFADVVGQKHVVETLERAVLAGKTSHAYLFCGPRGNGKTTLARILAKALLCERGPGQLPCGTCDECVAIANDQHPDVHEMDAASRTGVDDVRQAIIQRVDFAPVRGRYQVFIVDEVHMLSTAAFNALLKTLEEPPSHVVFILCTTDPQKVPATILSRVQRFDFHSSSEADIAARLAYVCEQEGFEFEPAALELVARHARGGMRDALSMLEQLSVAPITVAAVRTQLGEVATSTLEEVAGQIARRDIAGLFATVARLTAEGTDLLQFTRDLAAHLRDLYVVSVAGTQHGLVSGDGDRMLALAQEAASFGGPDRLSRVLVSLGETADGMRYSLNQRLELEVALTKLCRPESELTLEALAERIEQLELRVNGGQPLPPLMPAEAQAALLQVAQAQAQTAQAQAQKAPEAAAERAGVDAAARPAQPSVPALDESSFVPMPDAQSAPAAQRSVVQRQGASAPAAQPDMRQVGQGRPAAQPTVQAAPVQPSQPVAEPAAPQAQQSVPGTASVVAQPTQAAPMPVTQQPQAVAQPSQAVSQQPQAATASRSMAPQAARQSVAQPQAAPAPQATQAPVAPTPPAVASGAGVGDANLLRTWKRAMQILGSRNASYQALLMNASPQADDGAVVTVEIPPRSTFVNTMLKRAQVLQVVEAALSEGFGGQRRLKTVTAQGSPAVSRPSIPQPTGSRMAMPTAQAAAQAQSVTQAQPAATPQPTPRPQTQSTAPQQPRAAAPQAAPQAATSAQPAPRQTSAYTAPWEEAASVPTQQSAQPVYDDGDPGYDDFVPVFEDDGYDYGYGDAFVVPDSAPAAQPQPQPAAQPAAQPQPPAQPAPQPAPQPQPAAQPQPAPQPQPAAQPQDLSAGDQEILEMLNAAFGPGSNLTRD